jgi:hypothetical protein
MLSIKKIVIVVLISLIFFFAIKICNNRESFRLKEEIVFITQFYEPKDKIRKEEIETCLINNINNEDISKIYLFVEKEYKFINDLDSFKKQKLVLINTKDRLSFKQVFEYSNKNIVKKNKDVIVILANSDIYFDKTLKRLNNYNLNKKFLALTRIEKVDNKNNFIYFPMSEWSQDTWIWKNRINVTNKNVDYEKDGIILGFPGCDNTITNILDKSGYKVENKCKLINTFHLHKDDIRDWRGKKAYSNKRYKLVRCE